MVTNQISSAVLEAAVQAQPSNEFDTHDLIFGIMRNRPREYVLDLHEALEDQADPFINLHTAIGRALDNLAGIEKQYGNKRSTRNVRGELSEAQLWTRNRPT